MRFAADGTYSDTELYDALRRAVLAIGGVFHDAPRRMNVIGIRGLEFQGASTGPFVGLTRHDQWFDPERYPEHLGIDGPGVTILGNHEDDPRQVRLDGHYPGLFATQDVDFARRGGALGRWRIEENRTIAGQTVLRLATPLANAAGAALTFHGYESDRYDDVMVLCYRFLAEEGVDDQANGVKRVRVYPMTSERGAARLDSSMMVAQLHYTYTLGLHQPGASPNHHALKAYDRGRATGARGSGQRRIYNWGAGQRVGVLAENDTQPVNIHCNTTGAGPAADPGLWSAGCQVFGSPTQFTEFLAFFGFDGLGRGRGSPLFLRDLRPGDVLTRGEQVIDHNDPHYTLLTVEHVEAHLQSSPRLPLASHADPADPTHVAHHFAVCEEHLNYFPITAYGWWHNGVHLHAGEGADERLCVMFDGEVIACRLSQALVEGRSGNFVLLRHHVGRATFYSLYVHLEPLTFPTELDDRHLIRAHGLHWLERSYYPDGRLAHAELETDLADVKVLKHPVRVEAGEVIGLLGPGLEAYSMRKSQVTKERLEEFCHLEVFSLHAENDGNTIYKQLDLDVPKLVLRDDDRDVYAEYEVPEIYPPDDPELLKARDFIQAQLDGAAYDYEPARRVFGNLFERGGRTTLYHDELQRLMQEHPRAMRAAISEHISTWAALDNPTTRVNHESGKVYDVALEQDAFLSTMSLFKAPSFKTAQGLPDFESERVYFYNPIQVVLNLSPSLEPRSALAQHASAAPVTVVAAGDATPVKGTIVVSVVDQDDSSRGVPHRLLIESLDDAREPSKFEVHAVDARRAVYGVKSPFTLGRYRLTVTPVSELDWLESTAASGDWHDKELRVAPGENLVEFTARHNVAAVRWAPIEPRDFRYSLNRLLALVPPERITEEGATSAARRVVGIVGGTIVGQSLDTGAEVTYAGLATIYSSLRAGRSLEQSLHSAKNIGQLRLARLTKDFPRQLLEGLVTDFVVDQVIGRAIGSRPDHPLGYQVATAGATFGIHLVLKLVGASSTIVGTVPAFVSLWLSSAPALADPESYRYLLTLGDATAFARFQDVTAFQDVIARKDVTLARAPYEDVQSYYTILLRRGTIDEQQYSTYRGLLDDFYRELARVVS